MEPERSQQIRHVRDTALATEVPSRHLKPFPLVGVVTGVSMADASAVGQRREGQADGIRISAEFDSEVAGRVDMHARAVAQQPIQFLLDGGLQCRAHGALHGEVKLGGKGHGRNVLDRPGDAGDRSVEQPADLFEADRQSGGVRRSAHVLES